KNSESTLPCSSGAASRGAAGSSWTATTCTGRSVSGHERFWSPMNVLRKRRSEPVTANGKKIAILDSHLYRSPDPIKEQHVPLPANTITIEGAATVVSHDTIESGSGRLNDDIDLNLTPSPPSPYSSETPDATKDVALCSDQSIDIKLVKFDLGKYLQSTGCLRHDSLAFQDNVYLKIGILAGMASTHGGGAMNMLSQSVSKYICGVDPTDLRPEIAEVGH
uniref:Uncharacterized protein n=1 Tax=Amphimedon queenslandica TaxID=400682 RepID=A0A1X7VWQ3_AMPQE